MVNRHFEPLNGCMRLLYSFLFALITFFLGYKSLAGFSACQFRPQVPHMACGLVRSTLRQNT